MSPQNQQQPRTKEPHPLPRALGRPRSEPVELSAAAVLACMAASASRPRRPD